MVTGAALALFPVTGPPGAGKTTALLSLDQRHPSLARFGVRDYGLHLAAIGDPLGLELRDTLLRQELLSNELVLREFIHFMDRLPPEIRSVAIEGYPRDLAQSHDLVDAVQDRGARLATFVFVDVSEKVARERVAERRLCLACGLPIDVPTASACPDCDGPIGRRGDDDAGRLERRLAEFHEVSAPVREHFAGLGLLRVVDGERPSGEVRDELAELLCAERGIRAGGNR